MLGYCNGAVRVEVVPPDLLELKNAEYSPEDHVEEVEAVGVVDHTHQCDVHGDWCAIRGSLGLVGDRLPTKRGRRGEGERGRWGEGERGGGEGES